MSDLTDPGRHSHLLAIHGLGATAGVWDGLVEHLGPDWTVTAPDLPGHGTSAWTGDYTIGALAAAVSRHCPDGAPMVIVGHSLGGAVGLALAGGLFRPVVQAVVAVGVKVHWTDDDVAGMAKVAGRGVRWFDTREEAADRALRQAGLSGLVPDLADSVVEGGEADGDDGAGRWRVAQDPATFAQRPLDMAGLVAAARCPVILGAGQDDAMVSAEDLSAYTDRPRIAADRGHNVQVEDPAWVAGLLHEAIDAGRRA